MFPPAQSSGDVFFLACLLQCRAIRAYKYSCWGTVSPRCGHRGPCLGACASDPRQEALSGGKWGEEAAGALWEMCLLRPVKAPI